MKNNPALITFQEGKSYIQTLENHQFKPPGIYHFKCEKVEKKHATGILLYIENLVTKEAFSIINDVTYYENGYWEETSQEEFKEKINDFLNKIQKKLL
ncbi:hypothetical protein ACM55F_10110 [Flavobacterium sp. XS2P12]|uniref:hypothetical protein n=1 Tax=Flavobacterium melibiosi TaxID=3398734 RepID=UPI003A8AC62C